MKESFVVKMEGPMATGKTRLLEEIKKHCKTNFSIEDGLIEHTLVVHMKDVPNPQLRVWHIPQVPGKPFYVEVDSVAEGIKVMGILADYDKFQYENRIKPDYCNVQGLHLWDESLSEQDLKEMELSDKWVDWFHEDNDGNYYYNPVEYLESINKKA